MGGSTKMIVKMCQERGVESFIVDEFRTSSICHRHIEESEKLKEDEYDQVKVKNTQNIRKAEKTLIVY